MGNYVKGIKTSSGRRTSRARRHARLRKKVVGTETRPRLIVNRSTRHIYAQVIDDTTGRTLVAASTFEADLRGTEDAKKDKARKVGELIGARAKDAGISQVVFDRGGNRYHGRVAAVADGAREAGLEL